MKTHKTHQPLEKIGTATDLAAAAPDGLRNRHPSITEQAFIQQRMTPKPCTRGKRQEKLLSRVRYMKMIISTKDVQTTCVPLDILGREPTFTKIENFDGRINHYPNPKNKKQTGCTCHTCCFAKWLTMTTYVSLCVDHKTSNCAYGALTNYCGANGQLVVNGHSILYQYDHILSLGKNQAWDANFSQPCTKNSYRYHRRSTS